MPKHEEKIGVKIPGQGYYMVSLEVGPFDTDEQVLSRISTKVGTVYNVAGEKFEVVKSSPFKLKKLASNTEEADEPRPKREPKPEKAPSKVPPKPERKSGPPPSDRRSAASSPVPRVGEQWKPRDPRRIATFTVVAVENDYVVTDDGRKIQLARFPRYERVNQAASKAS